MIQSFSYKKSIALFVLGAFIAQTFSKSIIVIDYYLNTAAFAANCINKDKPEMHCNGHCQMMKQLKAEDKKDQQNPERKFENKNEITLSDKSYFAYFAVPETNGSEFLFPILICGKETKTAHSVFHPPTV